MPRIRRDALLAAALIAAMYVAALYGLGQRLSSPAGPSRGSSTGAFTSQPTGPGPTLVFQFKTTYSPSNHTMTQIITICRPVGVLAARAPGIAVTMPRKLPYTYNLPYLDILFSFAWGFQPNTLPLPSPFSLPPGTCVTVKFITNVAAPPKPGQLPVVQRAEPEYTDEMVIAAALLLMSLLLLQQRLVRSHGVRA